MILETPETDSATSKRNDYSNWSNEMNLMHENLARAHMDARLREARELRRSLHVARSQRLARRAERASQQVRLLLARSV